MKKIILGISTIGFLGSLVILFKLIVLSDPLQHLMQLTLAMIFLDVFVISAISAIIFMNKTPDGFNIKPGIANPLQLLSNMMGIIMAIKVLTPEPRRQFLIYYIFLGVFIFILFISSFFKVKNSRKAK